MHTSVTTSVIAAHRVVQYMYYLFEEVVFQTLVFAGFDLQLGQATSRHAEVLGGRSLLFSRLCLVISLRVGKNALIERN